MLLAFHDILLKPTSAIVIHIRVVQVTVGIRVAARGILGASHQTSRAPSATRFSDPLQLFRKAEVDCSIRSNTVLLDCRRCGS